MGGDVVEVPVAVPLARLVDEIVHRAAVDDARAGGQQLLRVLTAGAAQRAARG